MALVLASASPRRRQLLTLLGVPFEVCVADVDESAFACADPRALTLRLAAAKCAAAAAARGRDCVIGCDTVVELDGRALGKPQNAAQARGMLQALAGRRHLVHTGVCIACGGRQLQRCETTAVFFAPLSAQEIEAYIATGEPFDKAGGYGIQGPAARFVTRVEGCYFNVMGLPVRAVYEMLCALGVMNGAQAAE